MDSEVGSLGGDEHAEGTPDVEPVQTLALGRQEEHRLDRSGQTGVLHVRAEPGELLLQVAVAVHGDDGEHLPSGGGRLGERGGSRNEADDQGGDERGEPVGVEADRGHG